MWDHVEVKEKKSVSEKENKVDEQRNAEMEITQLGQKGETL